MRKAARAATRLYDGMLAETGLRLTQYSLLANLDRCGALPMTALAEVLGMERTTLTRNVAPLRRAGLLSLKPAGYGRTKLVALTARGRTRLVEAFPYWQKAEQRFADISDAEDVRSLQRLTGSLTALEKAGDI